MSDYDKRSRAAWAALVSAYCVSVALAFLIQREHSVIVEWTTLRGFDSAAVIQLLILLVSATGISSALAMGAAFWVIRESRRALNPGVANITQTPQALALVGGFLLGLVPFAVATF